MAYDAILIPGGGITVGNRAVEPNPWVIARLEEAMKVYAGQEPKPHIITLSAATVHKPINLDDSGLPILESGTSARYLIERGIDPRNVTFDLSSRDTMGDAYFSRVDHVDILGLRALLVITSEFHLARAQAIFELVYGLIPNNNYTLEFIGVENRGLDEKVLQARREKEKRSLDDFLKKSGRFHTLVDIYRFLYNEHAAYSLTQNSNREEGSAIASY